MVYNNRVLPAARKVRPRLEDKASGFLQQRGHCARINDVLLREHPRGQCVCRVLGQYRHHRLVKNRPDIQLCSDTVHGATGKLATRVNRALVRVQAGEGGQQ